jgi:hypothetical protein
MSLKENVEKKLAAKRSQGPKRNPEIDAMIDRYIKEHPDRIEYLKTETKDQLVRRAVLRDALKYDASQRQRLQENEAVGKFLKENPDIAQDIEKRISRVPDAQKEQARIRLGRREATKSALKIN